MTTILGQLGLRIFALSLTWLLILPGSAFSQVASALIREGEPLPGDMLGTAITSINNTAVNGIGGYAFTVNTEIGPTTISHVWGNAGGGAGDVIVSEGTYGDLQQTSFESFLGVSDQGIAAYSALSTNTMSGATSLDGAWLNENVILNEEDPVPNLAGQFSTFNSRVGITQDGNPYWIGGYSSIQGGSTENRALFFGASADVVLKGGDSIIGVVEPVDSTGLDFDVRFSELGTNYIMVATVDASSTNDGVMVSNGAALMAGGAILREDSPVPAAVGGLPGENYDNFDFLGITESGSYLITGDTTAPSNEDEFVMVDGMIVLREGTDLDGATVSGAIEGGYLNRDGDWAVIWDVDTFAGNIEALIVNGRVVLTELDQVDWNGDGVIDGSDQNAFIASFTGISSVTLSPRDADDHVNVFFTADCDIDGNVLEGGFRIAIDVGPPIVNVASFDVTQGTYVGGGLAELQDSDNADLSATRSTADVQSRVFIEFNSLSPTETPARFDFQLEAAVFARSTVIQSIDLFNYRTSSWETVDSRNASRITDLVTLVMTDGDRSRFVQPATGLIAARARFESISARQRFSALIDQVIWIIE